MDEQITTRTHYPTQEQCFEQASRILARGLLKVLSSDPREAAERAYMKGVTPSVDELEARIRQMQAEKLEEARRAKEEVTEHRQPPAPIQSSAHVEMPLRPGEVERHYPIIEVARLLGMSRDWVYDRIDDGTFIVANFGDGKSKRRIPASSIQAFINSRTY